MTTGLQDDICCRRTCITGEHVLEEVILITYLFNICCRYKQCSFLVSKGSLCVSLVDISSKSDQCSSSVSFGSLSDCVVVKHVGLCCSSSV